jgi:hypothetical protein
VREDGGCTVIISDLDEFRARVTPAVLNLMECMSERMRRGMAIWEGLPKPVPPSEMGKEAIAE